MRRKNKKERGEGGVLKVSSLDCGYLRDCQGYLVILVI
jgi:hypothetical protein